jgi:hypothetical protein
MRLQLQLDKPLHEARINRRVDQYSIAWFAEKTQQLNRRYPNISSQPQCLGLWLPSPATLGKCAKGAFQLLEWAEISKVRAIREVNNQPSNRLCDGEVHFGNVHRQNICGVASPLRTVALAQFTQVHAVSLLGKCQ